MSLKDKKGVKKIICNIFTLGILSGVSSPYLAIDRTNQIMNQNTFQMRNFGNNNEKKRKLDLRKAYGDWDFSKGKLLQYFNPRRLKQISEIDESLLFSPCTCSKDLLNSYDNLKVKIGRKSKRTGKIYLFTSIRKPVNIEIPLSAMKISSSTMKGYINLLSNCSNLKMEPQKIFLNLFLKTAEDLYIMRKKTKADLPQSIWDKYMYNSILDFIRDHPFRKQNVPSRRSNVNNFYRTPSTGTARWRTSSSQRKEDKPRQRTFNSGRMKYDNSDLNDYRKKYNLDDDFETDKRQQNKSPVEDFGQNEPSEKYDPSKPLWTKYDQEENSNQNDNEENSDLVDQNGENESDKNSGSWVMRDNYDDDKDENLDDSEGDEETSTNDESDEDDENNDSQTKEGQEQLDEESEENKDENDSNDITDEEDDDEIGTFDQEIRLKKSDIEKLQDRNSIKIKRMIPSRIVLKLDNDED